MLSQLSFPLPLIAITFIKAVTTLEKHDCLRIKALKYNALNKVEAPAQKNENIEIG